MTLFLTARRQLGVALLLATLSFVGCAQSVDTNAPVTALEQQELEDQIQMLEQQARAKVSMKR